MIAFEQGGLEAAVPSTDHATALAAVRCGSAPGAAPRSESAILAALSAITQRTVTLGASGSAPDIGYWPSATIVMFSDGQDGGAGALVGRRHGRLRGRRRATADWPALNPFPVDDGNKLRGRFWQLLSLMTRTELCCSSPAELASRINCSERHFRGLFRKEFGVSIQAYQSALRQVYTGRPQPPETVGRKTAPAPCVRRRRPVRRFSFPKGKPDLSHASEKSRKAGDSAGPAVPSEGKVAAKTVGMEPG